MQKVPKVPAAGTPPAGITAGSVMTAGHQHEHSIRLAIPRKSMGAVHGYDEYLECRHCGDRIPRQPEPSRP